MEVTIRTAETKDYAEILSFLDDNFFLDEPLNRTIGLLSGNQARSELEAHTLQMLREGLSTVAEVGGVLAGVCINEVLPISKEPRTVPPPLEPLTASDSVDAKFLRIKTLMDTVDISANLAERFPDCDSMFDTEMISVSSDFRGKGIANKLLDAARKLAIARGLKLARCICSSRFSARVVERLGYQCVHRLPYTDFKDTSGEPVFKTEAPHTEMTTYVLPLTS